MYLDTEGPWNKSFLTYTDYIIYDIKVTDNIDTVFKKLGSPLDTMLNNGEAKSIWREEPYLITIKYFTKETKTGGKNWGVGTIISVAITRAIGN